MVNIRNSATMTPAGFPWYDQWGSARYASNNAFLHAVDYSEPFFILGGFKRNAKEIIRVLFPAANGLRVM